MIDFDPRPKEHQYVSKHNINKLVVRLQDVSNVKKNVSMWETQLLISYDDYMTTPSMLPVLEERAEALLANIMASKLMEIDGNKAQSQSEKWTSERWSRITASTCLEAHKVGKKVMKNASNAATSSKKFVSTYIWNINNSQRPQTAWMRYGLQSETAAVKKYETQTNHVVSSTGLWVNPKFPFIACSPDGLVGEDGLLEIKSLKIFHDNTIDKVIDDNGTIVSKDILNRQCFSIHNRKCVLKKSHSYYFQIQCQLLVTERKYCDFVLYAKDGPVSIKRIYRDEQLITDILSSLTTLWKRIIAPEVFEMRVPRDLDPFVMPSSFLTNASFNPHGNNDSSSCSDPHGNGDGSSDPHGNSDSSSCSDPYDNSGSSSGPHGKGDGSSDPFGNSGLCSSSGPHGNGDSSSCSDPYGTSGSSSGPLCSSDSSTCSTPHGNGDGSSGSHGNGDGSSGPHGNSDGSSDPLSNSDGSTCSNLHGNGGSSSGLNGYTTDEMDIAFMLTTCASSYVSRQSHIPSQPELIVIPWDGTTSDGVTMINTCPIDNWLIIFQSLTKSGRMALDDLTKAGDLIRTAIQLVELNKFADAKVSFLPQHLAVTRRARMARNQASSVYISAILLGHCC